MNDMSRKVLFVTYGGGHVQLVISLLPFLESCKIDYRIFALTTAQRDLEHAGYSFSRCADYLPARNYDDALLRGAELSRLFWNQHSAVSWHESCAYMGVSMLDLIADKGEIEAKSCFQREGRSAFCPVSFMLQVLEREKPCLVVVTCLARMEKAAVIAAKRLGVKSVLIEDLFAYSLLGRYCSDTPPVLVPPEVWPDSVVVMNQKLADLVRSAGFPPHAVHPLGQPLFAQWLRGLKAPSEGSAMQKSLASEAPQCIAYATPAVHDVALRHSLAIRELAEAFGQAKFCIKLHPSLAIAEVSSRLAPLPQNLTIVADVDNIEIIKSSSLFIIFNSTLGVLALLACVPLIVFDDSGAPEVLPYVSSGAAVGARSANELKAIVAEHLNADSRSSSRFVHPLFENSPQAGEHIAAWLQEQLAR